MASVEILRLDSKISNVLLLISRIAKDDNIISPLNELYELLISGNSLFAISPSNINISDNEFPNLIVNFVNGQMQEETPLNYVGGEFSINEQGELIYVS